MDGHHSEKKVSAESNDDEPEGNAATSKDASQEASVAESIEDVASKEKGAERIEPQEKSNANEPRVQEPPSEMLGPAVPQNQSEVPA